MLTAAAAAASTQGVGGAEDGGAGPDAGPLSPTGEQSGVSLPPPPLEKPSTPPPRDVAFEEFKKVTENGCSLKAACSSISFFARHVKFQRWNP